MRAFFLAAAVTACASSSTPPAHVPEPDRTRAETYAREGAEAFAAGDRARGIQRATFALVVRLAACGYDCPEVAYSFVQLGDMRYAVGQRGWAAQSYKKALEVLAPHARTHAEWIAATRARLTSVCQLGPFPACEP